VSELPEPTTYEPLINDEMLASIRDWAYKGLQTEFVVKRKQVISSNPYGDDQEAWVEVFEVMGWIKMINQPVIDVGLGLVSATNVFRLELPIDADIRVGDKVAQDDDRSHEYVITDTNDEDTLQVWRSCFARRLE
jgi:hypothetical protein